MRYAVNIPNFAPYDDPRVVADLARAAEDAGWDGFFVWDHVTFIKGMAPELSDPWVLLTAVALATERIRLGPMVTPLARRRMSTLARQTTTLDRLSGGRLVQGVGLGDPLEDEFGAWGESADAREVGDKLDESLDVLTALWSEQPVRYAGKHLTVDDVTFHPGPVQRPRIPVWVAGRLPNPRPMRRAARWDGVVPLIKDSDEDPTPAQTAEVVALVSGFRPPDAGPFDVVVSGRTGTPAEAAQLAGEHAEAGATWYQEAIGPWRGTPEQLRARVEAGPV